MGSTNVPIMSQSWENGVTDGRTYRTDFIGSFGRAEKKCSKLTTHCVKIVLTKSFSCPCFSTLRLNTEIYGVNLHSKSECIKIRTRNTPNMDTFHALKLTIKTHVIRNHPFSTYAEFSEKPTFLNPDTHT